MKINEQNAKICFQSASPQFCPQSVEYFISQERRTKHLEAEIEWRKKEKEMMEERINKIEIENQEFKKYIEEERISRKEKLEIFPEKF